VVLLGLVVGAPSAAAAQPPVGLGTATPFAVLGGSTVTNTGPSVLSGDLGVYPGSAITGFPPGTVINGTQHAADAVALQAQSDVTTAYNDAAGRSPVVTESSDLGGQTLAPGVYQAASALSLTGTVTLNGGGDPSAVFIFQAGSTLITASSSTVSLIDGAQACNVFWQVGSSATLGTTTTFVGTILALTSASLDTGATVQGRVFARNGAVTLDDNTITQPTCAATTSTTTSTTTAGGAATTTSGTTGGTTAASSGAAGSGSTGAASTAASEATGTSVGTASAVVPLGSPATGFGGAARTDWSPDLVFAGAVLMASGVAMALITRRRRPLPVHAGADPGPPGE
jgi:type VI secretion system secreted protein VgrG